MRSILIANRGEIAVWIARAAHHLGLKAVRDGPCRLGAGAAPRVRPRHDHRAGAHRKPAGRRVRQGPASPRRHDRTRCSRQGGTLYAAVQCAWFADHQPVRHAWLHGRPRGRASSSDALCLPPLRNSCAPALPCFIIVARRRYGLGAPAMAAGELEAPVSTVAWPTGEFGPMRLEGAVKLGFRNELEAAAPGAEQTALYNQLAAPRIRQQLGDQHGHRGGD